MLLVAAMVPDEVAVLSVVTLLRNGVVEWGCKSGS